MTNFRILQTRSILGSGMLLAAAAFALSPSAQALSPPPPQADDELLPLLYETMGGENWHNNDGWLDPDVHWCDWYGVVCGAEFWPGYFDLYALELAGNNLAGEMTPELANLLASSVAPEMRLDLRDNAIAGSLQELPVFSRRVWLGNNRLSGPLPSIEPDAVTEGLTHLELDNNLFEGEVPSDWEGLSLKLLDLSNNRLEGAADPAFRALDTEQADLINLSDNAFSGELPAWITQLTLESDFGAVGSINICWTELSVSDADTRTWVSERHVGGHFDSCLARERRTLDPSVSGSWFEQARSGEGYSVMLLDNGIPLVYWFTHLSHSRQMWLIGTGQHEDTTLLFHDLLRTEGRFSQGYGSFDEPISHMGELRMDGVAGDRLHLSSQINYFLGDLAQPGDGPIIYVPNPIDFRTDLVRLSELAGTTCDNQSEFQQYSGAWYNPERSGEGFIVEVLPDDRAVIYWFTYQPDESGEQAWMIGQSDIGPGKSLCTAPGCEPFDAVIEIDAMLQPVDTGHSFPADLSGVEMLDWGEVHINFDDGDGDSGYVYFDSEFQDYGTGDFTIQRLAQPMLADCPEGDRQ